MNTAKSTGAIGLELINRLFAGATLTMYSGTQPVSPETALSGNTVLVTFTFSTPAFGAPSYAANLMTATGTFVAASVSPSNSGTVTFARATLNVTPGAWAGSTSYSYGNIVSNSGNYYLCVGHGTSAGSGGPTTTTEGITDNTVTWNYIGATSGQGNVNADYTCGTSGTDIILGSTSINTGVPVDITSFTQSIPVV